MPWKMPNECPYSELQGKDTAEAGQMQALPHVEYSSNFLTFATWVADESALLADGRALGCLNPDRSCTTNGHHWTRKE